MDNRGSLPRPPSVLPDSGDDDFLGGAFGKQSNWPERNSDRVQIEPVVNPRWAEREDRGRLFDE